MMANNSPTANDIQTLLTTLGYHIRRPSVSSALFFAETKHPSSSQQPILLNIYYTTRSIMTYLNHPTSGRRELWRSNAYESLDELASIVRNPRMHTGKGYRNKNKAMRGCVGCGMMKERVEFSENQWRKGPDENRCLICVEEEQSLRSSANKQKSDEGDDEVLIRKNLQNLKLRINNNIKKEDTLTTDMLRQHDRTMNTTNTTNNAHETIERRQFSCPICPKRNRGPHIFYKKVPSHKPIIKCPKCKAATNNNDNLRRLYPIPKGEEKGYGLYKCHKCRDFWGSSRAVGNVGQNCFKCAGMGRETYVKPFRMEVHKRGGKKKGGNNGRKKMVPKEPIGEEEVDERFYGDNDRMRNEAPGNNSYGGGGGGEGDDSDYNDQTYDFVDTIPRSSLNSDRSSSSSVASSSSIVRPNRIPRGYQHKCYACPTGACRNRKVPKSEVRDEMDGNTVSTRASIVTNSSMDKTDFVDRDEDFSGFEEDSESGGGDDGARKQEQKINEEDSNEAIIAIGETFTCEQLVQQKFDHAAANGYIIKI